MNFCKHCGNMNTEVGNCNVSVSITNADPGTEDYDYEVDIGLCKDCTKLAGDKLRDAVQALIQFEVTSRPIRRVTKGDS